MLVPAGMSTAAMRGDFKRSEEHTSELQSQSNLVCRLLLEKKKLHPSISGPPRDPLFHGACACVSPPSSQLRHIAPTSDPGPSLVALRLPAADDSIRAVTVQ